MIVIERKDGTLELRRSNTEEWVLSRAEAEVLRAHFSKEEGVR